MINMSSKHREIFGTTLLALALSIQAVPPVYAKANVANDCAQHNARSTVASNLISNKDDDDDDDEQDQREAKNSNDSSVDGSRSTSEDGQSKVDPSGDSSGLTNKLESTQNSTGNSENSSTSEPAPKETAPSWNDSSASRVVPKDSTATDAKTEKDTESRNTHKENAAKKSEKNSDKAGTAKPGNENRSSDSRDTKSSSYGKAPEGLSPTFYIDGKYSRKILNDVDAVVCKRLYSKKLADTAWKTGVQKNREAILNSKNLRDLHNSVNAALAELKSSHCNFVTVNDEMYHFLHALFADFNKKMSKGKADCVGFVTGGAPFDENQVRYILNGGPAAKAGLQIGDKIIKVNGHPYVGYINFLDTSGKSNSLTIERKGETKSLTIKPEKDDLYSAYIKAMRRSVSVENIGGKKIGYVHVWSGGRRSFEALDEILEDKLGQTDGLIFDIRDGYGGNSLSDLDRFYRSPKAYPDFETVDRNGKKSSSRYYYDKPIVAIINGGSRSGKELLSFSLKRTGRAKLVGTNTAGAVLAGSLFKIDDKTSLYLAVLDGTVDGVRLEGVGVAPDVVIDNTSHDQSGYEKQLQVARETLLEQLKK